MLTQLQKLRKFVAENPLYVASLLFICCLPLFAGKIITDSQAYIFGQYINYLQIRVSLHLILGLFVVCCAFFEKAISIKSSRTLLLAFTALIILSTVRAAMFGAAYDKILLYGFTGFFNATTFAIECFAFTLAAKKILTDSKNTILTTWAITIMACAQTILGSLQLLLAKPLFPMILTKLGQPPEFTSFSYVSNMILSRAYGTTPHPHILAGTLLVFLFILLSQSPKSLLQKSAIFVTCIGIVITLSKVGIFAAVVLFVIYFLREKLQTVKLPSKNLALIAFGALQSIIIFALPYFSWSDESFLETRAQITTMYLKLLQVQPLLLLFGTGYKWSIPTLLQNLAELHTSVIYVNRILAEPPHNLMLLLVVEAGLPITIALLFAMGTYLNTEFRELRPWQKIAIFALLLILGSVDHFVIY